MTSSPARTVHISALKMTCLAPAPTMISSGEKCSPFSARNLPAMAALSSGVPPTSVYRVCPLAIARRAASWICCGVSKSGSPAVSASTSRPWPRSARARWLAMELGEGRIRCRRVGMSGMVGVGMGLPWVDGAQYWAWPGAKQTRNRRSRPFHFFVARHWCRVTGQMSQAARSHRSAAQGASRSQYRAVLASDATPRCAPMASADRQMTGDATLRVNCRRMNITFKQLEAFVYSAKLRSFSSAAAKLRATQSAISKRVAELEQEFGVPLLHRTAKGLEMAQAGRRLLPLAEESQRLWARIDHEMGGDQTLRGNFRVGVTELIAMTWITRFIQRLRQLHPEMSIEPVVAAGLLLFAGLGADKIDITNLSWTTFP